MVQIGGQVLSVNWRQVSSDLSWDLEHTWLEKRALRLNVWYIAVIAPGAHFSIRKFELVKGAHKDLSMRPTIVPSPIHVLLYISGCFKDVR